MTPSDKNPTDELYERFRADLRRPVGERYYSEEELTYIFDTAGDKADDYTRMETLMLGARLYPDSPALLERRAIFYRFYDPVVFDALLDDNPEVETPLWDVLKLARFKGNSDEARSTMAAYIESHRFDTDEQVIQLIGVMRELNVVDWIFDHLDVLRSKVDYQPTLLYEIAMEASAAGRHDVETAMLEQLTRLEPYTDEYWSLLASAQLAEGNREEARQAVDMALAINPDNAEALRLHLQLLDKDDPQYDVTLLKLCSAAHGDIATAIEAIQRSLAADNTAAAHGIIDEVLASGVMHPDIVSLAASCGYSDMNLLYESYYDTGYHQPEEWIDLGDRIYESGNLEAVSLLMQVYERRHGSPLNHDYLLLRILYTLRQYELAVNVFTNADADGTIRLEGNLTGAYAMALMSMLRLGRAKDAEESCNTLLKLLESENYTGSRPLEIYGLKALLNDVLARLHDPDSATDWDSYDPLGLD